MIRKRPGGSMRFVISYKKIKLFNFKLYFMNKILDISIKIYYNIVHPEKRPDNNHWME